ncbi:hypothetical protein BD309DRAFT_490691 [Dichomitus squalens]|nr:hypothetical protein BD309DRAFT_490691 [Dichomitus squalens]
MAYAHTPSNTQVSHNCHPRTICACARPSGRSWRGDAIHSDSGKRCAATSLDEDSSGDPNLRSRSIDSPVSMFGFGQCPRTTASASALCLAWASTHRVARSCSPLPKEELDRDLFWAGKRLKLSRPREKALCKEFSALQYACARYFRRVNNISSLGKCGPQCYWTQLRGLISCVVLRIVATQQIWSQVQGNRARFSARRGTPRSARE